MLYHWQTFISAAANGCQVNLHLMCCTDFTPTGCRVSADRSQRTGRIIVCQLQRCFCKKPPFSAFMHLILSGVLISRFQHGSRCSYRMHKHSISSLSNPRKLSFVCHAMVHLFGEPGSLLTPAVFSAQTGLGFKGQLISPLA